jgi:hypothetical protein
MVAAPLLESPGFKEPTMKRPFSTCRAAALALLASAALLAPGCAAEDDASGDEASGKADESDGVLVAQAGAFRKEPPGIPQNGVASRVHFGFTDTRAPGWKAAGDVVIEYDADGNSLPVRVPITGDSGRFLGFVIFSNDRDTVTATADQFIDLEDELTEINAAKMVELPLQNHGSFSFEPECFRVVAQTAAAGGTRRAEMNGFINYIYFGFTSATAADYLADPNVPWENSIGEKVAETSTVPAHVHDGGFKGTVRMLTKWVRVPAGKNLVYKPGVSEFGGICGESDDTGFKRFFETATMFVELAAP